MAENWIQTDEVNDVVGSIRHALRAAQIVCDDPLEWKWLSRFHYVFRNQFVHFAPRGWSIETSGIPEIAKLVARIISEIDGLGWAFRHLAPAQRVELHQSLDLLIQIELSA